MHYALCLSACKDRPTNIQGPKLEPAHQFVGLTQNRKGDKKPVYRKNLANRKTKYRQKPQFLTDNVKDKQLSQSETRKNKAGKSRYLYV